MISMEKKEKLFDKRILKTGLIVQPKD